MIWTHLFQNHILDRGLDYYERGLVSNIDITDELIKGLVHGTDEYFVQISIDNGEITDMDCDCPHAFDGNNCKHMVALLYSVEYYDLIEEGEKNDTKESDEEISISKLVDEADENIIRNFLINILEKDEKLLYRFKNTVITKMTHADVRKYKTQINSVFRRYGGKHDFIDYNSAQYFYFDIMDFIYEDLSIILDNGQYEEAFELINHIFVKLGNQDMDDSGGQTSMIANSCVELWEYILDNCNEGLKGAMFRWFMDNLDGSVIDYMEDYLEDILFNNFLEKEYLSRKLKFIEDKIQKYKQVTNAISANYHAEKWTIRYLEILEEQKLPQNKIEEYYKENLEFNTIRKKYADYCLKNKDYDLAIKLLKDGKSIDKDYRGIVADYSLQLKEIYKNAGKFNEYKKELWSLVLKYKVGDINLYKELKSLYSTAEWEEKREKIFEKLPRYSNLDKLYEEEKLYDRLLNLVINSTGLYKLNEYEKFLKKLYPRELLYKYELEVKDMASYSSNRNKYREIVSILRRMQKYPGGKEKVKEITDEWKIKYRNRRAMMDELSKL